MILVSLAESSLINRFSPGWINRRDQEPSFANHRAFIVDEPGDGLLLYALTCCDPGERQQREQMRVAGDFRRWMPAPQVKNTQYGVVDVSALFS